MARHNSPDIRNVAIIGHGGAGKTILTDAFLLAAKRITRVGSIAEGTSHCDFDEQEREQQRTIDTAITFLEWKGKHVNVIDTPGYPDSIGEAISGLRAADAALLAVDSTAGVKVNTRQMWKVAQEMGVPCAIVVTRADLDHARWEPLIEEIRASLTDNALPYTLPEGGEVGQGLSGVEVASAGGSEAAQTAHGALLERAVEADEELMMRYLEGEELSPEEQDRAIAEAFVAGGLNPLFVTAAEKGVGVEALLDAIAGFFPSPAAKPVPATLEESGEPVEVEVDSPFSAYVFRITYDPFVGKLCYLKLHSGTLKPGDSVRVKDQKSAVKIAHIYSVDGKETKDIDEAVAGDIVAFAKIEELDLGDTLTKGERKVVFPMPSYPTPMVGLAVQAKSRADDTKIGSALGKLVEAEPTLKLERNPQTTELVITGMSNLHLDTVFARLKSRYKVEVETRLPKVPYLETVTTKSAADYRHKKQTGGAGQFAHVYLRIEPKARGEGFEFASEIVGGAISSSFLPSIEKGIKNVMNEGVVAGFPFVDVKVVVYDGKEHPVDSKDIAFQIAGRNAFKAAVDKAKPVLLEPIANVEITAANEHMGALMGDINTRRGRITKSENHGDLVSVMAQVPEAEMQTYSSELRSLTGGEGTYTMERSHYEPLPQHLTQQVIAAYRTKKEES